MNAPKIFAGSSNPTLAKSVSEISRIPLGKIDLGKFSDSEIDVWVEDDVNNSNVFILQSNSNPVNDNIIELLSLTGFELDWRITFALIGSPRRDCFSFLE